MGGTKAGAIKAAETMKLRYGYGQNPHAEAGRLGGLKRGVKKGFAARPDLAAKYGRLTKRRPKP